MRKILVLEGDSSAYAKLFLEWGQVTHDVDNLEDVDLVVFTGGTDVNPLFYGEKPLDTTQTADTDRDTLERGVYTRALFLELPMVGICRGAQFLNVMNNGKLVQHMHGHGNTEHELLAGGKVIDIVRGDHHQSMLPSGEHSLLSTSADGVAEEIFWPLSRCLGVQWHPEWHDEGSDSWVRFQKMLELYLM